MIEMEQAELQIIKVTMASTSLSGGSTYLIRDAVVDAGGGGVAGAIISAPAGIAAGLMTAWNQPQNDGSIDITKSECNENVRLGDVINITGGRDDWETMRAPVQQITRNLNSGKTVIGLGVAAHLSLNEFAQLLKVVKIAPALDLTQQSKGEAPTTDGEPTTMPVMISPRGPSISSLKKVLKMRVSGPTWEFLQELGEGL